ncbi:hypothetical protein CMUS01_04505 [Colletotrichum musicola]|uniref:Uncharacterized protein n=1 Tax=Colletotrichum musicola TaxID=2175873 RepID=A0A8H6KW75_9PEZI|nr:hypothetical protein CMUS01_04505 [Colletotrichum musicola]
MRVIGRSTGAARVLGLRRKRDTVPRQLGPNGSPRTVRRDKGWEHDMGSWRMLGSMGLGARLSSRRLNLLASLGFFDLQAPTARLGTAESLVEVRVDIVSS